MKKNWIEGCMVMLLMVTVSHGYPAQPDIKEEALNLSHNIERSDQITESSSAESDEDLELDLKQFGNVLNRTESVESSEMDEINISMQSRQDESVIQKREDTAGRSKGFTNGLNFETDRIGIFPNFFPFLNFKGFRPYSGRSHYYPRPHKPSPYSGPNHFKPPPYSFNDYHSKPDYKPHGPGYGGSKPYSSGYDHEPDYENSKPHHDNDYESPKPGPLPPFPPDGPQFSEYMSDIPDHLPPFKPHSLDDEGFDFDFDPPDFFENSGFPHSHENVHYEEEHEEISHEIDYPMKPYSDDDELEFYPPETYDGFKPLVYKGPPKPHKHILAGPKPRPPNSHKFMFPPDLNIIVEEGIYRDDIPLKDVQNDRDKVTDDLPHGGIKGLDDDDIDFIVTNTRPYVESHNEYDDQWSRKISSDEEQ